MYVAKDLHGTKAYEQLRNAVNQLVPDERARPNALGRLVKMVLNNINTNSKEWAARSFRNRDKHELDIDSLMEWAETNEGPLYWGRINDNAFGPDFVLFKVAPKVPEKPLLKVEKPAPKVQPQKRQMKWWGAV